MKIFCHIKLVVILLLIVNNTTYCLGQSYEKILFQTDRELYIAGEDILINAFLLTDEEINYSRVLYVEVYDTKKNIIEQIKFEIHDKKTSGRIKIPESINTQLCFIRAYTNFMKNFSVELIPTKLLTVINPSVPISASNSSKEKELINEDLEKINVSVSEEKAIFSFHVLDEESLGLDAKLYDNYFDLIPSELSQTSDYFKVMRNSIPDGLNYVAFYKKDNNKLVAVRPFFNWGETSKIDFSLTNTTFKPRERVDISIQNRELFKNISISVVKKGTAQNEELPGNILNNLSLLNSFLQENQSLLYHLKDTVDFYLDKAGKEMVISGTFAKLLEKSSDTEILYNREFIGATLTGIVLDKENNPVNGAQVDLSVFNGKQQLHTTKSDSTGKFSLSLYPGTFAANRIMVQTVHSDSLQEKILLDYDYSNKFVDNTASMDIDSSDRKLLEELYINLQITKRIKIDNNNIYNDTSFFMFGEPSFSVKLDDYINLPNLEEVFSEIIPYVSVKRKSKVPYLSVFNEEREIYYNSPLVLLDFISIYNIDALLKIKPVNLSKIDVINRSYCLGDYSYDGIVSIITKNNQFSDYEFPDNVVFLNFEGTSDLYDFYHVNYSETEDIKSRIPDFRTTLYWNPNVKINTPFFYTSDHCSDYQIIITGVDDKGNIVKSIKEITVSN